MWRLLLILYTQPMIPTSELMPAAEDPLREGLSSLLASLLPQLPSCLVLVYPASSRSSYLDLIQAEQGIRVALDSPALQQALLASYHTGCRGYVTDAASAWEMLTALGEARMKSMHRQTPRILVLPDKELHDQDIGCRLMKHHEAAYIPDILLVEPQEEMATNSSDLTFTLLTNQYVGTNESGSHECLLLGVWPLNDVNFYPDKVIDLQGKGISKQLLSVCLKLALLDLVVFSVHYPPYTMLKPDLPFDGLEARFVKEFCMKYNCTLRVITDDDLWGKIFDNGTGIGMSGAVVMDRADLGIGSFGAWLEEYTYADYPTAYYQSRVAVLVPQPQRHPEWSIPVLPFTPTLWALQVASVLTAALALASINKLASSLTTSDVELRGEFSTIGGILLRYLAMAVLQPPPDISPTSPLRRFFTIFKVLFLFFTTIYSGALSSVLTAPVYYPPIDSPQELYEAGIPWAADHDAWVSSIKDASEPYLKGLVARFERHDTEELIELAKTEKYGFCVEILAAGHVTQMDHISGDMIQGMHVMKEKLYSAPVVFINRKGSPYAKKINDLMMRCLDAGLLLLWETDVSLTYLGSRLQTALKISMSSRMVDDQEPTQLKVVHLQGAFYMLVFGLALASLAFLGEIYIFKNKERKAKNAFA